LTIKGSGAESREVFVLAGEPLGQSSSPSNIVTDLEIRSPRFFTHIIRNAL
jgi:hypothetical protein